MTSTALAFVRHPEQSQRLEDLLARVTAVNIGDLLTYEDLLRITGLRTRAPLYQLVISANKALLPGKTMLVNVRNQGYRKATAHQQIGHADKRRLSATRHLRKSVDELHHVDEQQLSEPERVILGHQLQLAMMRLDAARRKTLEAQQHTRRTMVANASALDELVAIKRDLFHVWKRIR